MIYDLLYTSAPKTLDGSGYGVVVRTRGFSARLEKFVRQLCYYDFLSPTDSSEEFGPPVFSHLIWEEAGAKWHVFSRVGPGGRDYTHRPVFLAHHVAIPDHVFYSGSPARLMLAPSLFRTTWDGTLGEIDPRDVPKCPAPPASAATWAKVTGDPLWAGAWVERWRRHAGECSFLFVPTNVDVLGLFAESLAEVPDQEARELTFCTLLGSDRVASRLDWAGVAIGTVTANQVASKSPDRILDLTSALGPAPKSAPASTRPAAAPSPTAAPTRPIASKRDEFADFMEPVPPRRKGATAATRSTKGDSLQVAQLPRPPRPPAPPPPPATTNRLRGLSIAAVVGFVCVAAIALGYQHFSQRADIASAPADPAHEANPENQASPARNREADREPIAGSTPARSDQPKFRTVSIAADQLRLALDGGYLPEHPIELRGKATLEWIAPLIKPETQTDASQIIVNGPSWNLVLRIDKAQLRFEWNSRRPNLGTISEEDKHDCFSQLQASILDIVPVDSSQQGIRIVFCPEDNRGLSDVPVTHLVGELLDRFNRGNELKPDGNRSGLGQQPRSPNR